MSNPIYFEDYRKLRCRQARRSALFCGVSSFVSDDLCEFCLELPASQIEVIISAAT